MSTIDLEVQDMICGSCVDRVTQALKPIQGVSDVAVDLQAGHVRVNGMFDMASERLISVLSAAGYPAKLAGTTASPMRSNGPGATPKNGRSGCCCR